jgi:hypothetical protein
MITLNLLLKVIGQIPDGGIYENWPSVDGFFCPRLIPNPTGHLVRLKI